jgi:hypothetical protein
MRELSNKESIVVSEKDRTQIPKFLQNEIKLNKDWVNIEGKSILEISSALDCFKIPIQLKRHPLENRATDDNRYKKALKLIYEKLIIIRFMNTQNLEFLQSNLKYFGFGDKLNEALEKSISEQQKEFQLKLEIPHFNNKMDYTLHFKKSDSTDMYFFNRYDATLQNGNPDHNKNQSFYINKGNGVTAKEAYNLLEGRSVHKNLINKEGKPYSAWLKIDFDNKDDKGGFKMKQFSEQYGYDLEKSLSNYPIKELSSDEQKTVLLNSLKKGNAQQVTIENNGTQSKYFIEAVPQYKNINVYDQKMNVVKRQSVQTENSVGRQTVSQKTDAKKEQKPDAEDGTPKQKQSRKKKLSI